MFTPVHSCAVTWPHYQFAEFPWPEELKQQHKDSVTPPAPVVQEYIEVVCLTLEPSALALRCVNVVMCLHDSYMFFQDHITSVAYYPA